MSGRWAQVAHGLAVAMRPLRSLLQPPGGAMSDDIWEAFEEALALAGAVGVIVGNYLDYQ